MERMKEERVNNRIVDSSITFKILLKNEAASLKFKLLIFPLFDCRAFHRAPPPE